MQKYLFEITNEDERDAEFPRICKTIEESVLNGTPILVEIQPFILPFLPAEAALEV